MLFPSGINKKITFAKPCGVNGTIVFRAAKTEEFLDSVRCKRKRPCGVNGTIVFHAVKTEGFLYSVRGKQRSDMEKFCYFHAV